MSTAARRRLMRDFKVRSSYSAEPRRARHARPLDVELTECNSACRRTPQLVYQPLPLLTMS